MQHGGLKDEVSSFSRRSVCKIQKINRIAATQEVKLTDTNIYSLVIAASQSAQGKPPQPIQDSAGLKDRWPAGLFDRLIAARELLLVEEKSAQQHVSTANPGQGREDDRSRSNREIFPTFA